ncbi:MAG: hypothetical protein J3K34DRAFT_472320 [Monoraphidium minutum]|nr:MAG: hypothetical protein J3K34DRAFT_472320 [Monoraphidium minutum]
MLLRSCRQTIFGPSKDAADWVAPDAKAPLGVGAGDALGAWERAPANALASLHDDVLSALTAEELLAAALVSGRLKGLSYANAHWSRLYASRWESTPLTEPAAALAGSWRRLFAAKAAADAAAAPWRRPCEWELEAALAAMVSSVDGAAERAAPEGPAAAAGRAAAAEAPAGDDEDGAGGAPEAGGAGGGARDLSVCFLVDGSGSVGEDDFESMVAFINTAAASFARRAPGAKICVLQFSNSVRTEVPLAAVEDPQAFRDRVAKMVRMNGGTNIATALAQAGAALRGAGGGADGGGADGARGGGGARLVVLLTDGRVDGYQSREAKARGRAMAARLADEQAGVGIWALGVGRGVDRQELVRILAGAAGPDDAAARYVDLCVRDDVPW